MIKCLPIIACFLVVTMSANGSDDDIKKLWPLPYYAGMKAAPKDVLEYCRKTFKEVFISRPGINNEKFSNTFGINQDVVIYNDHWIDVFYPDCALKSDRSVCDSCLRSNKNYQDKKCDFTVRIVGHHGPGDCGVYYTFTIINNGSDYLAVISNSTVRFTESDPVFPPLKTEVQRRKHRVADNGDIFLNLQGIVDTGDVTAACGHEDASKFFPANNHISMSIDWLNIRYTNKKEMLEKHSMYTPTFQEVADFISESIDHPEGRNVNKEILDRMTAAKKKAEEDRQAELASLNDSQLTFFTVASKMGYGELSMVAIRAEKKGFKAAVIEAEMLSYLQRAKPRRIQFRAEKSDSDKDNSGNSLINYAIRDAAAKGAMRGDAFAGFMQEQIIQNDLKKMADRLNADLEQMEKDNTKYEEAMERYDLFIKSYNKWLESVK